MENRITINMNDTVWYKPNDYTEEIRRKNQEELWKFWEGKKPHEFQPLVLDSDGYAKAQLWELFQDFGAQYLMQDGENL